MSSLPERIELPKTRQRDSISTYMEYTGFTGMICRCDKNAGAPIPHSSQLPPLRALNWYPSAESTPR